MFKDKFIACLKVDDEIVREDKNIVFLPYDTKFTLFFKNLRSENITIESIMINNFQIFPVMMGVDSMSNRDYRHPIVFSEDIELCVKWNYLKDGATIYNNMEFFVKGLNIEEQVSEVITTKSKKLCSSCGKKFKGNFNFCPFDGTYLQKES